MVDVRPSEELASRILDPNSSLKLVLEAEPDIVSAAEFVAKLGTWLALPAHGSPP
jgi:hypothetical protein